MDTRHPDSPTLRHWIIAAVALPALLFVPPALAAGISQVITAGLVP